MKIALVALACLAVASAEEKGQPPRGVQPHNFFGAGGFDGFGKEVAPGHGYTGINFDEGPAQKLVEGADIDLKAADLKGHEISSHTIGGLGGYTHGVAGAGLGVAGVGQGVAGVGHGVAGVGHGLAGLGHGFGGVGHGFGGYGHGVAGLGHGAAGLGHGVGGYGHGFGGHGLNYGHGYGAFGGHGYNKLKHPTLVVIKEESGKGKGRKGNRSKGKGHDDYDYPLLNHWSHDYHDEDNKGKGFFKGIEKGMKSMSKYWNDYMSYNSYESVGPRVIHAAPIAAGHGYKGVAHGIGGYGGYGHHGGIGVAAPLVGGLGHLGGYGGFVGGYHGGKNDDKGDKGKGYGKGKGHEEEYIPPIAVAPGIHAPKLGGYGLHKPSIGYGHIGGYGAHGGFGKGLPIVPKGLPIVPEVGKGHLGGFSHVGLPGGYGGYGAAPINLGHHGFHYDNEEYIDDGWYGKMKKEFDKAYEWGRGLFYEEEGKGKGSKSKGSKGHEEMPIVLFNKPLYAPRPYGFFAHPGYGLPGSFHDSGYGVGPHSVAAFAGADDLSIQNNNIEVKAAETEPVISKGIESKHAASSNTASSHAASSHAASSHAASSHAASKNAQSTTSFTVTHTTDDSSSKELGVANKVQSSYVSHV